MAMIDDDDDETTRTGRGSRHEQDRSKENPDEALFSSILYEVGDGPSIIALLRFLNYSLKSPASKGGGQINVIQSDQFVKCIVKLRTFVEDKQKRRHNRTQEMIKMRTGILYPYLGGSFDNRGGLGSLSSSSRSLQITLSLPSNDFLTMVPSSFDMILSASFKSPIAAQAFGSLEVSTKAMAASIFGPILPASKNEFKGKMSVYGDQQLSSPAKSPSFSRLAWEFCSRFCSEQVLWSHRFHFFAIGFAKVFPNSSTIS